MILNILTVWAGRLVNFAVGTRPSRWLSCRCLEPQLGSGAGTVR